MQEADQEDPNRELFYFNVVTLHIATPVFSLQLQITLLSIFKLFIKANSKKCDFKGLCPQFRNIP